MKLINKIAVITGAGSGIGEATAKRFAIEGATVILFGRTMNDLKRVAAIIGGDKTLCIQGDISQLDDLNRLYDTILERYGKIDILVANAGVAKVIPLENANEEAFDYIIDINIKGTYFTIQKGLGVLNENSSVILISTGLDIKAASGYSIYAASKAAVRSLARSFALELAPRGIRVNTVAPGPITTPIMRKQGLLIEQMEQAFKKFKSVIPSGRIGKPEEMASTILFLASNESSYVNASAIYADGGYSQV